MPKTARAKLKYLKIAPKKVRLLTNVIKGMTAERAIAELELRNRRSSPALKGLLRSAIANAANVHGIRRDALAIKSILVDPGPPYKRMMPRAMGRATPIMKRTSHVTIVLEEKEGVQKFMPKIKKEFSRPTPAVPPQTEPSPKIISETEEKLKKRTWQKSEPRVKKHLPRFIPKIFQRKAI
jgi:large subunit ribosomal protein L22